jgi:signal transduction histidine kinase
MRADGKLIYIQDSATAIKDANGRTLYYEGTIVDVTETNAYRNQIEQLNQSLRVVNSILRHDIMNDLTVAIGSVDLYRRKSDAKLLDMAEGSMRKCSRLIRKMKELESIISNNALKMMSARDVIREVLGNYSSHSVDFQVEGDGLILADEAVVPALDNVISNAVVHGRSDKVEVQVASSEDKRWCEVRVCDHGKGVPDEIKELIFHEGFRYGDTGNTGLGLYIVKKTMERYGGQVRVEDLRPSGAAFVLRFQSPVGGQFVGRSLPA